MLTPQIARLGWAPPTGTDAKVCAAGVHWDAVRLPAYLGDRVLALLDEDSGGVIRDPYGHYLYWLVRPGTADDWMRAAEPVRVLGAGSWVVVPPAGCVRSTGPHWARVAEYGRLLTDVRRLSAAIAELAPQGAVAP